MNLSKYQNKILLSFGAISVSGLLMARQPDDKPNIIYILADDMGYADLGCYGAKDIKTPNIDKLAANGIRFTQHYAGTAVSAPSRCSLITGLHTGHTQVRGNMQWKPYGQVPLETNTVTIASQLKKAGYNTAIIGKWGLGVEGTTGDPNKLGFDYSYGYLCQVLAHNHSPEFIMENGKKVKLSNKAIWLPKDNWHEGLASYATVKKDFSQKLFTQKAFDFIDKNKENPFFLFFSVIIPHRNDEAPVDGMYSDIPSFKPYSHKKGWSKNEKGYASMITYLDKEVGKIVAKLKATGLDKNTLIIFTSDNGPEAPGRFYNASNAPFRGIKRDLYEGGIRIPFIAYWPEKIKPGISNHPSAFWDFMPTACELAGIEAPAVTDGISYLPELLGKPQKKHDALYFEFHEQGGKQAIIEGKWKCIRLNTKDKSKTTIELYNLENDISESNNLANQYPGIVDELISKMTKSHTENKYFNLFR